MVMLKKKKKKEKNGIQICLCRLKRRAWNYTLGEITRAQYKFPALYYFSVRAFSAPSLSLPFPKTQSRNCGRLAFRARRSRRFRRIRPRKPLIRPRNGELDGSNYFPSATPNSRDSRFGRFRIEVTCIDIPFSVSLVVSPNPYLFPLYAALNTPRALAHVPSSTRVHNRKQFPRRERQLFPK